MIKKTVVILEENQKLIEELKNALEEDFLILKETNDGEEAINFLEETKPDFLITNLFLAGTDGLWILEELNRRDLKVKTIVLSNYCQEEIVERVMASGAYYFMIKPFNLKLLKERMVQTFENKERDILPIKRKISLEEKISKIFINVGIPPHIKGYSYLREGVKMAVNNPEIINNITKKLYPKIGEKYETSASKVERAIRHAIEVAWNRGRIENINNILGVKAFVGAEKPTNGEFIALVADKMILEEA
ncbi:MAG: sporulation transcription factor Spo0A [Clostridiales bacterium]|nr:sporulation transcription factor Spo0A [Clostridiales bacterium]